MSDRQLRSQQRALVERFRRSMMDKAKLAILSYMEQNPHWTPEELKIVINVYIRKYGLNNRYVPDRPRSELNAMVGEESKVETKENDPDHGRTETAPSA